MTGIIVANGKEHTFDLPCTIEAFLLSQSLLPRGVVVEHNGSAIAPSQFKTHLLNSGDRIEIVQIVAGG